MPYEFNQVFTRYYLQQLPEEDRKRRIKHVVDDLSFEIVRSASAGKKEHLINMQEYDRKYKLQSWPPTYHPTTEDLVEALKDKFRDCDVEYKEFWEEITPGQKKLRKGIMINWS